MLDKFHETLSKKTTAAALALKEVLGPIKLEPVTDKEFDPESIIEGKDPSARPSASVGMTEAKFKPYYVAHTKIRTLALLDERYKGSNWCHWRRGRDSNSRWGITPTAV